MEVKSTVISIAHVRKSSQKAFDDVIVAFEKQLGHVDMQAMLASVAQGGSHDAIKAMEGSSGLMIFGNIDMAGAIPSVAETGLKARQYLIGNPLIASQMTCHHIEVGLYVPLRVFVTQTDKGTMFVYDKPTSLLGQWHNYKVDEIAASLEIKLENLIDNSLS